MQTPESPGPNRTMRAARRLAVVVAAVAALVVASAAVVAAIGRGPEERAATPSASDSSSGSIQPSPSVPAASPTAVADPSPGKTVTPSPTPVDPNALADGTYPAYITRVNVRTAAITVDVVQLFEGQDAIAAAVEDGMSRRDARYLPVYIRDENPLLRTLRVSHAARIHLLGECEVPPNLHAALTELKRAADPTDRLYYYEFTLVDGQITLVTQHLAQPAC
jgi:hypothetical protein